MDKLINVLSIVCKSKFIEHTHIIGTLNKEIYNSTILYNEIKDFSFQPRRKTKLMYAAYKGDVKRLRWLLARNASINKQCHKDAVGQCSNALMFASAEGHLNIVCELLAKNADTNIGRISDGCTSLMWATTKGHLDIVHELILYGAKINALRKNGLNALMMGCEAGHFNIITKLIEEGAQINSKTYDLEMTPFMFACQAGQLEIVRKLLSYESLNVDLLNLDNYDALMLAIEENHLLVVREILTKGISVRDNKYIDIAIKNNNFDMVRELILYGAKVNNLKYLEIAHTNKNNELLNILMNYLTNEEKMKLINEWMNSKTIMHVEKVEKKIEKKTRVSKK
jgi:ankyrin repeat protein